MTAMAFINVRPIIKVGGEENPDLQEAITAFVVNNPLSGMTHAELTITHWIQGESGSMEYGFQSVTLGSEIEILMENDKPVFKGEVTAVEERYGEGAPQLVLLAQDKLHRLVRQRNCRTFDDTTIDDIAQTIGGSLGLNVDASVSSVNATYHQINESDLAFLHRVSSQYDISVRIDNGTLRAKAEEEDPEPVEISARDSALGVRLIADLNHQPKKVFVNGFNAANDEATQSQAESISPAAEYTAAADMLNQLGWPGDEIVPQPFPRLQGEGDGFSQASFNRAAKRFVAGEIRCQGEPALKSGREIELTGVSDRFLGRYRIVHCVHQFDSTNGYETHLKVNKADWQI